MPMPAAPGPQPDPYELLGVPADASSSDIARAYRRLARALHPDSRPGDPAAAGQFQALTLAYEVLSNPARRAAHDQQRPGHAPRSWPPAGAGVGQATPAIWPLDLAVPGAPPPRAAMWAGPVITEPALGSGSDDLAGLIRRFMIHQERWPW